MSFSEILTLADDAVPADLAWKLGTFLNKYSAVGLRH